MRATIGRLDRPTCQSAREGGHRRRHLYSEFKS
jgi:hypothetical protein